MYSLKCLYRASRVFGRETGWPGTARAGYNLQEAADCVLHGVALAGRSTNSHLYNYHNAAVSIGVVSRLVDSRCGGCSVDGLGLWWGVELLMVAMSTCCGAVASWDDDVAMSRCRDVATSRRTSIDCRLSNVCCDLRSCFARPFSLHLQAPRLRTRTAHARTAATPDSMFGCPPGVLPSASM